MPEFAVRVEWEYAVETDPTLACELFNFCLRRVLLECEQRDLMPIGVLSATTQPVDATLPGLTFRPIVLRFKFDGALAAYTHEVACRRRIEQGIPHPVRLED